MGVELNGLVHFYFRVLIVLTVIHVGSVLMLIPKKRALIVNLSLCVSLCACMHRTLYI